MYRFTLRPGWLLAHVVVLAIAALFTSLGAWQLRRLDEVRRDNARVRAQLATPPVPLDEVLEEGGDIEYRRVRARGTFLPAEEVLLSPRSRNGVPGHDVLTPLALTDGRALLVDRGWVPLEMDSPPVAAPPPSGTVTVQGWLRRTAPARQYGPSGGERIEFLSVADADRLAPQVSQPLIDAYLVADHDTERAAAAVGGSATGLPRPPPPLELDEGPHLAYAVQWFLFTLVGLVGYPLLIRRRALDARQRPVAGDGAPAEDPDRHAPVA